MSNTENTCTVYISVEVLNNFHLRNTHTKRINQALLHYVLSKEISPLKQNESIPLAKQKNPQLHTFSISSDLKAI